MVVQLSTSKAHANANCVYVLISRFMSIGAKMSDAHLSEAQLRLLKEVYGEGYLGPEQLSAAELSLMETLIEPGLVTKKYINYGEYVVGSRYQLTLKGFRFMVARDRHSNSRQRQNSGQSRP